MSKTFTATLLASRKLRGTLQYSDKLVDHVPSGVSLDLPGNAFDKQRITLKDLAIHASGLERNGSFFAATPPVKTQTAQQLFDQFVSDPLAHHQLHTGYAYSNIAYSLLADALDLPDHTFENQIKNRILEPLGMNDTTTIVTDNSRVPEVPGFLLLQGQTRGPAYAGAGGYHSSLDDMMTFLRWNMKLESIDAATDAIIDEVQTDHTLTTVNLAAPTDTSGATTTVGLAWEVTHNSPRSGMTRLSKGGADGAWRSYIAHVKGQPRGVVILVAGSQKPGQLGKDILKLITP